MIVFVIAQCSIANSKYDAKYANESSADKFVVEPSDTKSSDESSMAFIQCKEFVKERLKAPSSADFPFLDYQASILTDNHYFITSYVEAQNAFGVKLKNNYTCSVKWDVADSSAIRNWELISLQIDAL